MKRCVGCGKIRRLSSFWKRPRRGVTGRVSRCKRCASIYARRFGSNRKEWRDAHREELSKYGFAYRAEVRLQAFCHYGGNPPRCACCGESTLEFLTIDHIGGGGTAHRRQIGRGGTSIAIYLRKRGFPPGYQILCYNCNCAQAFAKICPHITARKQTA